MSKLIELLELNVNEFTEQKGKLTYLSWANAWREFIKVYPNATYKIEKENGNCFFGNPEQGYMVYTSVTVDNLTHEMWLPIMDNYNKTLKTITSFDVNKSLMRCLTKNLAMFGLGLYIYAGEDLPDVEQPKIDCNDLIMLANKKGASAKNLEKAIIKQYGHGMEFITKQEYDAIYKAYEGLPDRIKE